MQRRPLAQQLGIGARIGDLVGGRRGELAGLGVRAMVGGLLACYMTATIVGMLT